MKGFLSDIFHSIDISDIVKSHVASLRKTNEKYVSYGNFTIFFIVPSLVTTLIQIFAGYIKESSLLEVIIGALSVLAGFLLNLLAIIFGLKDKILDNLKKQRHTKITIENKRTFLRQLYGNISYSIVISIISIVFLLLSLSPSDIVSMPSSIISYFLMIHFILSLFMIMKRIFIIFKIENFVEDYNSN